MLRERRDFLKLCGLAGLGFTSLGGDGSLLGGSPRSDTPPYEGPYYVVIDAGGGWDTTYLMDPKGTPDLNRLYTANEIVTRGVHRLAPTAKHKRGGMSNEDFFRDFGNDLLVLNGLDYSVNSHDSCARYMTTGKLDSYAYPTFAALVAACKGPECPLAFLTFGGGSATGNLLPKASVTDLSALRGLANADAIHGNTRTPYHDDFALARIEEALREQNAARAIQVRLPRQERAESMLYAAQVNSRALARVVPYIPANPPRERLPHQAEIALAAFKAGVCVSAGLWFNTFDSHANNDPDQMLKIPELLAGIAYLLRRAEALEIRDKLVIIMQSEMGRTNRYNHQNGKDHWSVGSIMFLGRGIRGNRVIGATDAQQFTVPINPRTLAIDRDRGIRVRPEHIHQALRQLAGIADHAYSRRFPLGANATELPQAERLGGLWG